MLGSDTEKILLVGSSQRYCPLDSTLQHVGTRPAPLNASPSASPTRSTPRCSGRRYRPLSSKQRGIRPRCCSASWSARCPAPPCRSPTRSLPEPSHCSHTPRVHYSQTDNPSILVPDSDPAKERVRPSMCPLLTGSAYRQAEYPLPTDSDLPAARRRPDSRPGVYFSPTFAHRQPELIVSPCVYFSHSVRISSAQSVKEIQSEGTLLTDNPCGECALSTESDSAHSSDTFH